MISGFIEGSFGCGFMLGALALVLLVPELESVVDLPSGFWSHIGCAEPVDVSRDMSRLMLGCEVSLGVMGAVLGACVAVAPDGAPGTVLAENGSVEVFEP
jgi:hypothetical protein